MPAIVNIDPWYDVPERSKIRVWHREIGGVTGLLQEDISFGTTNQYNAPFAQVLSQFRAGYLGLRGATNADKKGSFELPTMALETTVQAWTGSSPLDFTLNLFYLARRSSELDVVAPIRRLIVLSTPNSKYRWAGEESGLSITGVNKPPVVRVEVGSMVRISRGLIRSLTIKLPSNVVDLGGKPNEAMVTLGITTHRVFMSNEPEVEFMTEKASGWVAP